jgi:O-antigen/teichoic acid export membrane protein
MNWMVGMRNLAQPGVTLAAVAVSGLLGASLLGGTIAYLVSLGVVLGLALLVLRHLLAGTPTADPPPLREVLIFSFPLIWTQLVAYGVRNQEILLLAYYRPIAEVGVYNAALKTAVLVGFILAGTTAIFTPIVASLHASGDLEKLRRLNRTVARWCYTIALPSFCACVLFGRQILSLWGHGFEEAWLALVLCAGAQLVSVATGTGGTLLIMGQRQKIELANSIAALLLGLLLDVLLIPKMGILGAAIGAGASMTAVNVLRIVQIQRLWGANPINVRYVKPTAAGLAGAAAAFGLDRILTGGAALGPWPRLLLGLPVLILVYAAVLWLLGFESDDIEVGRSIQRRLAGWRAKREPLPERPQ